MKIEIEICSVAELAAIFALVRADPLDPDAVKALTARLATSADALKAAEDAAPPTP